MKVAKVQSKKVVQQAAVGPGEVLTESRSRDFSQTIRQQIVITSGIQGIFLKRELL